MQLSLSFLTLTCRQDFSVSNACWTEIYSLIVGHSSGFGESPGKKEMRLQ